jgi:hypothetical protein
MASRCAFLCRVMHRYLEILTFIIWWKVVTQRHDAAPLHNATLTELCYPLA